MVKCKYKGKCSSEGMRCEDCIHNEEIKEDYYQPRQPYGWITYQPDVSYMVWNSE